MGIDQVYARGDTTQIMGITKWTLPCNWKFAVDNVWDFYHAIITHPSAGMAGWRAGYIAKPGEMDSVLATPFKHVSVLGEYGHAIGGWAIPTRDMADKLNYGAVDTTWRDNPESEKILGEVGMRAANAHPTSHDRNGSLKT